MSERPLLELRGISKSFGSVQALRGADFTLAPGEVHALLGENGAGKSTLMHIAYGLLSPDRGTILIGGRAVAFHSPRDARDAGLGMVHQHFTSIGPLSVEENIRLAVGRTREGADRRIGGGAAGWSAEELRRGLEPGARVESLSVALRQRLEIVKALAAGAQVLLLDEPTAVLAPREIDELLALLRRFVRDGGAVALITHKLPEVLAVADRVTVLRNGAVTLTGAVAEHTAESLAKAMIGEANRRGVVTAAEGPADSEPPSFRKPDVATVLVRIGDIAIHGGELIGIAAIEGNGQRELLRGIAGVGSHPEAEGQVTVDGPVAFVPEDRTNEGLIPLMSLTENVVLGLPEDSHWSRGWRLDWAGARAHTAWLIWTYGIRAPGPDVPAGTLSGGNQQKLILARALAGGPRILVAENPTRGLDVRATAELHERLRAAAQAGVAVFLYSTDLDEVLELGQRVLVVHAGQVREAPHGAGRGEVGEMMLGLSGDR